MDAAAASILIILFQSCAPAAELAQRPPEAPLVFVRDEGGRWRSALGPFGLEVENNQIRVTRDGLRMVTRFAGSSAAARVVAGDGPVTQLRRFSGSKSGLREEAGEGRQALRIAGLYDGIDLVVRTRDGQVKSEFIVAPGADPQQIRMSYEGARSTERLPNGDLEVRLEGGIWREKRPVAWESGAGHAVRAEFLRHEDGTVGFDLGEYDRTIELVIDPVLSLSTLLGGQGSSAATAVAVDAVGDVYVAGYTDAMDFPVLSPVRSRSGGVDAWVVKIRPGESRLLWATCLGGVGDDRAFALALDPAGGVYVSGWTASPDFPVASPAQPQLAGGRDAFILKLTTGGDRIVFSSFFGGASVESGLALTAYAGGVWVAGETMSADLPVLGAAQTVLKGVQDGFLARYNDTGSRLSSTYFGGSGEEMVRAMALDGAARPYVAGSTESSDLGLPSGVFRRTPAGGRDGFVLRFTTSANALDSGTLLGGSAGSLASLESVTALAIDAGGGIIAAGYTPSSDFPVASAWQTSGGGDVDGFLARIAPDFGSLTWSTYVGGLNRDTLDGLALDSAGRIYVAGKSISPNFPTVQPVQSTPSGNQDAVLMRFPAAGGAPDFSTLLGGTGGDGAVSVAVSAAGVAWLAGTAGALDFPQVSPVVAVVQPGLHAFVSGVAFVSPAAPVFVSQSPTAGSGLSQVFTFRYSDQSGGGFIQSAVVRVYGAQAGGAVCFVSYDASENKLSLNGDAGAPWSAGQPGEARILSNRQCDLRLSGSSITVSGAYLDMRLDLGFNASFVGARTLSSVASNGSGMSTGWVQSGTWTVTGSGNQAPGAASVSPVSGGGIRQLFTFQFSDSDGAADLDEASATFGHAPASPFSCTLAFSRGANRILLLSDDGSSWSEAQPGASDIRSNGQCTLRLPASTFNLNGTVWTVTADLEFNSSWAGAKGVFLRVGDASGNSRDWSSAGTYRVGGSSGSAPALVALAPSNGSGSGALFEVQYRDTDGSSDIKTLAFLINGSHKPDGGCLILAERGTGALSLAADNAATWSSAAAGQPVQLQNSQCVLKVASSTFTYSGQVLTVRLDIGFKTAFLGSKTVWSHASDTAGRASPPFGWTGAYNVTSGLP